MMSAVKSLKVIEKNGCGWIRDKKLAPRVVGILVRKLKKLKV